MDDHLSGTAVACRLKRPTRAVQRAASSCPYSVLLRVGFTKQTSHLASGALLPHRFILARIQQIVSGRFVFCGTFLRVAPTGRYPAPCSVQLGLSSDAAFRTGTRGHHIGSHLEYLLSCCAADSSTSTIFQKHDQMPAKSPGLQPWGGKRAAAARRTRVFGHRSAGHSAFAGSPAKIKACRKCLQASPRLCRGVYDDFPRSLSIASTARRSAISLWMTPECPLTLVQVTSRSSAKARITRHRS